MRKRVEYAIYKDTPGDPEYWDGSYSTRTEARHAFDRDYRNEGREQDFVVVKVIEEPMPLHRRCRRSPKRT